MTPMQLESLFLCTEGKLIWRDGTITSRHFPSSCFHTDTEFLESSGHLLIARDTDIMKIEPLALSYWEFTLSGVIYLKSTGFPCICIQIIFFSGSYG